MDHTRDGVNCCATRFECPRCVDEDRARIVELEASLTETRDALKMRLKDDGSDVEWDIVKRASYTIATGSSVSPSPKARQSR